MKKLKIASKVGYNNWVKKVFDVYWFNSLFFSEPLDTSKEQGSIGNCACFEVEDNMWKNCDCDTVQHYVCRKSKPVDYDQSKSTFLI